MNHLSRAQLFASWILQLVVAGILLQTLFFKFTGAEESVYIFTTLGLEPWGRIGSGVAELIASVLLLIPATTTIGAILAMGIMAGAIMSHLTLLGIEVKGDGGVAVRSRPDRLRRQRHRPAHPAGADPGGRPLLRDGLMRTVSRLRPGPVRLDDREVV